MAVRSREWDTQRCDKCIWYILQVQAVGLNIFYSEEKDWARHITRQCPLQRKYLQKNLITHTHTHTHTHTSKNRMLILYPYLSSSVGPYYATNLAFLTSRRMRTCRTPTQDSYNDIHQDRICHELSQWIGKVKYLRWRYCSRECTSKVTWVQSIMLIAQEWVF